MTNKKPLVSIIILNLNRKKDLMSCLKSLKKQTYSNYEIIIIDNASIDGSVEEIRKKYRKIIIYKTKKNLGTSYTRNAGVKFSKGELIWFLDNDISLENKNTLKNLIQLFNNNTEIDGIGGEAKINKNKKTTATKSLKLFKNGLTKGYFYKNKLSKIIPVEVLPTCNLLIKKKIINKIGGFDHFYFFYLEDIDLTYRATKKGYKLFVYHKCSVIHNFSETSRFKNHFTAKKNRIYFILKNYNISSVLLLPFYDFFYIFNYDNVKRIYSKFFHNQENYINIIKESEKNISFINILNTFKITSITLFSIINSYIYIPIYILKYSFGYRRSINYLKEIKTQDFNEIKN
jgi:GT2 family glycosyltransferase